MNLQDILSPKGWAEFVEMMSISLAAHDRKDSKMKIIDKKYKKSKAKWHRGDVVHVWDDNTESSSYILLADDESHSKCNYKQGILLYGQSSLGNVWNSFIGSNQYPGSGFVGHKTFSGLITDLKNNFDHVEKCKNPKLVVNDEE